MANKDTTSPAIQGRVIYVLGLVALVQSIYPITADGSLLTQLIYQVLYASLLVVGILVARDQPVYTRLLTIFSIGWLFGGVIYAFNSDAIWASLLAYGSIVPFQCLVALVLVKFIFSVHQVNRDVIYAASAVYLLIGAIFVPIFGIIETITFAQTGGLHAFTEPGISSGELFPWQTFIYYSYATLTTLGYGDVLPVTMWARSVATLEAIVGVLFITIIMARLVGLYASQEIEQDLEENQKKEDSTPE